MFEKAQSTTPQQEVCVPGSELWHVGKMGGMQQNPEERHNFHMMLMHVRPFSEYGIRVLHSI